MKIFTKYGYDTSEYDVLTYKDPIITRIINFFSDLF